MPIDLARKDGVKLILLKHTTPQEVQHIIPALLVFSKRRQKYWQPREMRKILRNYMIQSVVNDKLKKAKQYLPDYDENELRAMIEKDVIEALRRTRKKYPYITHDPDPFGTFYHGD